MALKKIPIKDVPKDFIINCITPYQQELIELRFYIFERFDYLIKKKKYKKMDAYLLISEEANLQPDTINKIVNASTSKLIFSLIENK
jgi:hypothetical protein